MIPIIHKNIDNQQVNTVDARELHKFLESKQDFSTWIKRRIDQYEFVENQDFVCFHQKKEANNATMTEYHINLDMAKELSMVERNAKGKQARKYFIECEKKAKNNMPEVPQSLSQALRLAADQAEQIEKITAQNQKMLPVVERHKAFTSATGLMKFSEAAKAICNTGVETGQNRLIKWLKENGYLFKNSNEAKQSYVDQGLFKTKTVNYKHPHTEEVIVKTQTYITPKGVNRFAKEMKDLENN